MQAVVPPTGEDGQGPCNGEFQPCASRRVAPLFESVPPRCYGGTERVVSYLTEELVHQGHEVTLFASGDSRTSAELVSTCPRALRLDPTSRDPIVPICCCSKRSSGTANRFDIMHFHCRLFALSRSRAPAPPARHDAAWTARPPRIGADSIASSGEFRSSRFPTPSASRCRG